MKKRSRRFVWVFPVLALIAAGCGSVSHNIVMEPDYVATPQTMIEIGEVSNQCGQQFDVDVVQMFKDALYKVLAEEALLSSNTASSARLTMNSAIVEYEKGNAFKRWLLPGWGATVLTVHCELKDPESGRLVGQIDARRTVSVGGGYTIGAWRTIMEKVAKDVAEELRKKIPAGTKAEIVLVHAYC